MQTIEVKCERPPVLDGSGRMGNGAFVVNGERFEFDGSPSNFYDEDDWRDQVKAAHDAAFDRAATLASAL